MDTTEQIDALADELSPAMCHVLGRCSDAVDWTETERYVTWPREWPDVVAHRKGTSFHGTVKALERRGLVELDNQRQRGNSVRLTQRGIRVQATLRLRGMRLKEITK